MHPPSILLATGDSTFLPVRPSVCVCVRAYSKEVISLRLAVDTLFRLYYVYIVFCLLLNSVSYLFCVVDF